MSGRCPSDHSIWRPPSPNTCEGKSVSKTDRTVNVCGEDVPVYVCDQCEEAVGSYLHWEHKDFTLCANCVEENFFSMFQRHKPANPAVKSKKSIPSKLRKEVFERDRYRCRYCGSHKDLVIDHILPESRGGPTTRENLATACKVCNTYKGARTPEEAGMTLRRA
ncbi:HNH endonuclease [Paenibacillus cisolokensis]|uniref:HNH endonuclease n=1 Tax=Paenibacillus cisolokensis TaxID=1658519 RepID=UPI003D2AD436